MLKKCKNSFTSTCVLVILCLLFTLILPGCGNNAKGDMSARGTETTAQTQEPTMLPQTPSTNPTAPQAAAEKDLYIVITSPTGESGYATTLNNIDLAGIGTDSIIEVNYLNSANSASGSASGTTSWSIPGLSLNEGDNLIAVAGKTSSGNNATDTITITYNKYLEFQTPLNANPNVIFNNEEATVVFSIAIKSNINLLLESIKLLNVDKNKEIANLYDNGDVANHGDDIAGDGVYSNKVNLQETSNVKLRVSANTNDSGVIHASYSEILNLAVIEHLTDADYLTAITKVEEYYNKYDEILKKESKNVKNAEKAQKKATDSFVAWLESQPEVGKAGLSESGNGAWWIYEDSGILGLLNLNAENELNGNMPVRNSKTIKTELMTHPLLQYYKKSHYKSKSGDEEYIENKKAIVMNLVYNQFGSGVSAENIWNSLNSSTCPKFEVDPFIKDAGTIERMKTLYNYGIVAIITHGDSYYQGILSWWKPKWGDETDFSQNWLSQAAFLTNDKATLANKAIYEKDLKKHRLAISKDGTLCILPEFIRYYNKGFPNSLIYIGACRSAYNSTMSNAFIASGAKTYYGYSNYVLISYEKPCGADIFNELVDGKNSSEAFDTAVSKNGPHDSQLTDPAYLRITGHKKLYIAKLGVINGSFEEDKKGWNYLGDMRVVNSLGQSKPAHGDLMAIISTGLGSVSNSDSRLSQQIYLPKGAKKIKFTYNVISEEPNEFIGSQYDDAFEAKLITTNTPSGELIVSETINTSAWFPINGINFYGGDNTTYHTGWKTAEIDVSSLTAAGKAAVKLYFHVWDKGDSLYDTAVLIDDVKSE